MMFPVAPILPGMVLSFAPRSILYLDCSRGIGSLLNGIGRVAWKCVLCCLADVVIGRPREELASALSPSGHTALGHICT